MFFDTMVVGLRESLEALLVIGILAGLVKKIHHPEGRRFILWGALGGVLASILLGWLAAGVAEGLDRRFGPWFEALTSFLAVAILSYMAVWMYKHTRELVGTLNRKAKAALAVQRPAVLASLAFVAIFREGVETVLFVAGRLPLDGAGTTVLAIATGAALSAVLAFLVFAGVVRMSIERFMAVSGAVLVVMAAGMLAYGIHELAETGSPAGHAIEATGTAFDLGGVLPSQGDPAVDTVPEYVGTFLRAAIGYRDSPTWAEVGAWALYLAAMAVWLRRQSRHDHVEGRPPKPNEPEPKEGTP